MSELNNISVNNQFEHLFRHESGRLVSMLTRVFGPAHVEKAEDVVQEAFMEALEYWQMRGMPDNPTAWLFRVAKNRALNLVKRDATLQKHEPAIAEELYGAEVDVRQVERRMDDKELHDDQLRMIFVCCHPALSKDSQIALALKTLSGFNIAEIARAFMTSEENVHKLLVRARQNLRDADEDFDLPQGTQLKDLHAMLPATSHVLSTYCSHTFKSTPCAT